MSARRPVSRGGHRSWARADLLRSACCLALTAALLTQPLAGCSLQLQLGDEPGELGWFILLCRAFNNSLGFTDKEGRELCQFSRVAVPSPSPQPRAATVASAAAMTVGGYRVQGTVGGGKLPIWSAELYPDFGAGARARSLATVDLQIGILALTDELAPATNLFNSATATVYSVDGKGKEKKIGRKSGKAVKDDGGATIVFQKVKMPGSHYRVEVSTSGGTVNGGRLAFLATAVPPGTLRLPAGTLGALLRARMTQR